MTRISIDPITRLEGHGKIEIFPRNQGKSGTVSFMLPEFARLRGFCVGRPARGCRV